MKILLTGATGYIGKRLLPVLIEQGHEVVCCVRDKNRFPSEGIYKHPNISLFEIDFLKDISVSDSTALSFPQRRESSNLSSSLKDIDAAYYLIHSMSSNVKDFGTLEEISANNFIKLLNKHPLNRSFILVELQTKKNFPNILHQEKRLKRF